MLIANDFGIKGILILYVGCLGSNMGLKESHLVIKKNICVGQCHSFQWLAFDMRRVNHLWLEIICFHSLKSQNPKLTNSAFCLCFAHINLKEIYSKLLQAQIMYKQLHLENFKQFLFNAHLERKTNSTIIVVE